MEIDVEYVKRNAKSGWTLNPNPKVVNGIIKMLNRSGGNCPCDNDADDLKCPCSNYRLKNKCCCTLYVREKEG